MISVRSEVQIFPGPPTMRARARRRSRRRSIMCGSRNLDPFKRGAVAQLGERLLCKQEVIGSIPFGSTRLPGSSSHKTSVERKKSRMRSGARAFALVLWLFDIVDRMQSTFGRKFTRARWLWLLRVVVSLGSDSARVNEVAKLCRAVVHDDGRKWSSEGSSAGFEREFEVGLPKGC